MKAGAWEYSTKTHIEQQSFKDTWNMMQYLDLSQSVYLQERLGFLH